MEKVKKEPCETEKEKKLHICTKAYIKEVNSTHTANTHEKSTVISISSFPPKTHTDTYNIPNQETSIFSASSWESSLLWVFFLYSSSHLRDLSPPPYFSFTHTTHDYLSSSSFHLLMSTIVNLMLFTFFPHTLLFLFYSFLAVKKRWTGEWERSMFGEETSSTYDTLFLSRYVCTHICDCRTNCATHLYSTPPHHSMKFTWTSNILKFALHWRKDIHSLRHKHTNK